MVPSDSFQPQVANEENLVQRFLNELPAASISFLNDEHFSLINLPASTFKNESIFEAIKESASTLRDLTHPNDLERIQSRLKGLIPSEPKTSVLFRLNPDFQRHFWLWLEVEGEFGPNHDLQKFHGKLTDVTSRKNAIDELQTNEQFYESILSTMPVQLVVFNEEHRYIYCNKTAIPNDHVRNWIIGKDDFEYCQYRDLDINIAWQRRYYFQKALAYRQEIKWEEEIWKDEETKVVSLRRLTPIYNDDGELHFVLGYGFDITDRIRAEERAAANEKLIKSINANIQDGIYRYSPQRGFLYVNDAFLRIFGYRSLEQLNAEGRRFFEKDPNGRKILIDIRGKQGSFNNREIPFQEQPGKNRFWGLVSCNKTSDPNEGIVYDGVIADITEFKEAEELLKRTNEELKQKNNDLDRFIYSASHDLRAPLTSIQGVLQLAEMDKPDETMQHYLDLISSSVYKLENFVNDLIDYYRNAKTQQSYHYIDFEELVYGTFEKFRYMEGAERLALYVENYLSEALYSDEYRLRIIISNLLSNAVKYQDFNKSDPYIKICISEQDQNVMITFADNGKGIPENMLEDIWGMFYKGGEDSQSSGMGLFIVKETVEKLGGTIKADSSPGEGTTFTLSFGK